MSPLPLASSSLSRAEFLRAGALGVAGLNLPALLRAGTQPQRGASAKACILLFLDGGPSHVDLWDMKPTAPDIVRGDFRPIETAAPGIQVCEHLPMFARQMQHVAFVRSVHHSIVDHNAGAYYTLTGRSPVQGGSLIVRDQPENFPPFGAVVSRLLPGGRAVPDFVYMPEFGSNNGYDLPGQRAGFLGAGYDPFVAGDPSVAGYEAPDLSLPADVPADRLARRRDLLARVTAASDKTGAGRMQTFYEQAWDLLASTETRRAFHIADEPAAVRERYGLADRVDRSVEARKFGGLPHLGQCLLLARRLIEAGVRLVTICSGRKIDQAWDTHRSHFPLLKRSLVPYFDRGFSALLEDLSQRGLLDETLVVAMGEFGRTPKLGQITSGAGAEKTGRDHWPHCYSVMLAGGGIRGGSVYGASDRDGGYPASNPVTPDDIAATIYHALGLAPETRITDPLGRPQDISLGKPIVELFG